MSLFPNRRRCIRNINAFPETDAAELAQIWQALGNQHVHRQVIEVEQQILVLLNRWQAFRNQRAPRNDGFLQQLSENQPVVQALSTIIDSTRATTSLATILQQRESIETVYNFLQSNLLQHQIPARIVTVSKAFLMISGFTPAFDSVILERMRRSTPDVLARPGVWPFCVFLETLEFVAREQSVWEQENGRMSELLPAVPIGQVMDRILWRSV